MGNIFSSQKYTDEGVPYHTLNDFNGLEWKGGGGYGVVFKGYGRASGVKRYVAVKTFNDAKNVFDLESDREIKILKTLSHKHIVELFGAIWDGNKDESGRPIFTGYVMEYLEGLGLDNEIHTPAKEYGKDLVILWTLQIALGLEYLHEKQIIHRDLKPANILVATRTHLKLADFGLARKVSTNNTYTSGHKGTGSYMAPEIINEKKDYGTQADIFSFGVTLWEIAHRKRPSEHIKMSMSESNQLLIEIPIDSDNMDEDLSKLVQRCCNIHAADRPSAKSIIGAINVFYTDMLETIETSDYNYVMKKSKSYACNEMIAGGDIMWDTLRYYFRETRYTPDGLPYHILNDFRDIKKAGSGGYSTVFKGYDGKKRRHVAIKIFHSMNLYSEREIQILMKHAHPNIVEVFGVIWDGDPRRDSKPIYSGYVMEYMKLGSLHNEIYDGTKVYGISLVASWIQQIASGLQYLHSQRIIHRNLKPRNVLLATKDHVKLAGLGLARNISDRNTYTSGWIGTQGYMAPEIIGTENYGPPVDIYSFGVTIWEIVERKRPQGIFEMEGIPDGSLSELIERCLKYNPSERPSLEEIKDYKPSFEAILAQKNNNP